MNDNDQEASSTPETVWVSVAEAAFKAGIDTGTVRQWYRSGRLPTQRSQGDRGSFLVPLDVVVALARGDEEGDAVVADLLDLNASYWSAQTEVARKDAAAARNELAEVRRELEQAIGELAAARDQLEFLRSQLAEASEDTRQLREQVKAVEHARVELRSENSSLREQLVDVSDELGGTRSRLSALEAELDKLRAISTATGSITDNAWLALPTNTYRSPVRPQGMAATATAGALSGLIADTTPDPAPGVADDLTMPALDDEKPSRLAADARVDPSVAEADGGAVDEPHEPEPAPTTRTRPVFGIHDDDLLPEPEKKGRRSRR